MKNNPVMQLHAKDNHINHFYLNWQVLLGTKKIVKIKREDHSDLITNIVISKKIKNLPIKRINQ